MAKLKTLPPGELSKLVKAEKAVYVLNTSALPDGSKGTIMVNFVDGSRREFLKIPPTFIPIAASDSIAANKLAQSSDFKQCLQKGTLTLVDPDDAEQYLQTEEASEEYESLVVSEHSMRSRRIDIESAVTSRSKVSHQTGHGAGPIQTVDKVDTVSNRVRGWVESMKSQTMSPKEVMSNLKRHQTALTAADLGYVLNNTTDANLVTYIQKALGEVQVQDAPVAETQAKKVDVGSFDFESDKMTPEEQAEDARARAEFASQQAVNGESKVNDEINRLLNNS